MVIPLSENKLTNIENPFFKHRAQAGDLRKNLSKERDFKL